ncbi:conserved domain protein [Actinomyces sp. oral taxon 170 str. F0386]|nr:conserved domain protein [Actinomyces sp. oral taxon 170 str. F0386]
MILSSSLRGLGRSARQDRRSQPGRPTRAAAGNWTHYAHLQCGEGNPFPSGRSPQGRDTHPSERRRVFFRPPPSAFSDRSVLILKDEPPPSSGPAPGDSGFVTPADSPTTARS